MRGVRILAAGLAACMALPAAAQTYSAAELARARRILERAPLVDGHNDLPWAIRDDFASKLDRVDLTTDTRRLTPPLHTDIPRLRQGGLGAQFWSVYVPHDLAGAEATQAVFEQIDLVHQINRKHPEVFELALTTDDVARIRRSGRIASLIGAEGGHALENSLGVLRALQRAGVRYLTLTHSKTIDWVDSATDAPRHGGLSRFGEEVVREMNRLGMLVDLSHVSAEAMMDAMRVSEAPVIFSHSSARALAQHPRNVPDEVLRLLPQDGGVVMINFNPPFVSEAARQWGARRAAEEARLRGLNPGDPTRAAAELAAWVAANPTPRATLAQVADHIEHVRRTAGVDHVGIGSDYDGVSSLPVGLEGVETYPALFAELLRRGWTEAEVAKVAGGNIFACFVLRRLSQHACSGSARLPRPP